MSDEFDRLFDELDVPRELPVELRDRLEAALVAGTGPRAIPLAARRRIVRRLARRDDRWRVLGLVAAASLLLLGGVALVTNDSAPNTFRNHAVGGNTAAGSTNDASRDNSLSAGATASGTVAPDSGVVAGGSAGGAAPSSAAARNATPFAPPYAYGAPATAVAPKKAPLRVAIVGGDADAEAGFRAYVAALNRAGGAGGHAFELVDSGEPAIVTVNLSESQIPTPSGTVFLEGLAASEDELHDNVFDVASVVEHSARIAASSAFPASADGERAVIFTGTREPFATRIPGAIDAVLRAQGVRPLRVPYSGQTMPLLPKAAAAFLSLPPEDVGPWLRAARSASYAPARGTWGVYSAAGESLLADMTSNVRVVSPFSLPATPEADALRTAVGSLSARSIAGWLTAKYLAVAVWRTDADDVLRLSDALARLTGFDDGFAPAYAVRGHTNSRVIDAVILTKDGPRFEMRGAFVRDTD